MTPCFASLRILPPSAGRAWGARLVRLTTAARPASDLAVHNERVLLANVLLNDTLFSQAGTLRSDDFTLSAHRLIFRRMRELHDSGKPIDMLTVTERLTAHNELEQAGGCAYLSQLIDGVVERSNIAPYVDLVRAYAKRKRIAIVCDSISRRAQDPSTPMMQLRLGLESLYEETAQDTNSAAEECAAEFSDDALALRFTAQHGDDLRFTAAWGHWSYWDGLRWKRDATRMVFDLARKICRSAAAISDSPRISARVCAASTVYAVERLASADRRHALEVAAPFLRTTPNRLRAPLPERRFHLPTGVCTRSIQSQSSHLRCRKYESICPEMLLDCLSRVRAFSHHSET